MCAHCDTGVLEGTLNWYKLGIREAHGHSSLDESQKKQRCCEASRTKTEDDDGDGSHPHPYHPIRIQCYPIPYS